MIDTKLLKKLCEIHAPSGNEIGMKEFLLKYIQKEKKKWKVKPEIIEGDQFQECLLPPVWQAANCNLRAYGQYRFYSAIFQSLLPIGSPDAEMGTKLVAKIVLGSIECDLEYDKENHAFYKFSRQIERGYRADIQD
jgi:hypothetical protein